MLNSQRVTDILLLQENKYKVFIVTDWGEYQI